MTEKEAMSDDSLRSIPWDWTGGYPQRITNPQGTLIAEVWDNPDLPAETAPLICEAVNAHLARRPWWRAVLSRRPT